MGAPDTLSIFGVGATLLPRLERARSILVAGDSDSGKTTLVEALADRLSGRRRAVVDLDTGQSRLGPPTTIGWALAESGQPFSWESAGLEGIYFTGTTSAVGNLLVTLTGAKLVFDRALAAADQVLVDTSGLVAEGPGWALKEQKIELLRPEVVIALQHERELEPILLSLKGCARPDIVRLAVPRQVRRKSPADRAAFRAQAFRAYFAGARELTVGWDQVTLRRTLIGKQAPVADLTPLEQSIGCRIVYAEDVDHPVVVCADRPPPGLAARLRRRARLRRLHLLAADDFIGRLVALRDADGIDQALGVISRIDWAARQLTVLTPQPIRPAGLVFGVQTIEL